MHDQTLFVFLPYAALAVATFGLAVRVGRALAAGPAAGWPPPTRAGLCFAWGVGLVLAGHALVSLFPGTVSAISRRPAALAALEVTEIAAALLAVAGLAGLLLGARQNRSHPTLADTLLVTLLAVDLLSGLALALLYRWSSVWSTVTVAPYLASLARLQPQPELIAALPLLVRLHLLAAFVTLAVVPFARAGGAVARALARPATGLLRRPRTSAASVPSERAGA